MKRNQSFRVARAPSRQKKDYITPIIYYLPKKITAGPLLFYLTWLRDAQKSVLILLLETFLFNYYNSSCGFLKYYFVDFTV